MCEVGRVWGAFGGGVCVEWGVCGVCESGVRSLGERKYRSPLYYPDTLVHSDTCLGMYSRLSKIPILFLFIF